MSCDHGVYWESSDGRCVECLTAERDALREKVELNRKCWAGAAEDLERARAILARVQLRGGDAGGECIDCGDFQAHAPDCELAAFLAEKSK